MERKYYLDNLRSLAILLLFPFHAAQIWSGGEYGGFYVWSHTNNILYVFSTIVSPWYMTLLFVIAGISSKYALQKRTNKQFIMERTKKLLVPFIFGVFVLVPVMTYVAEIYFNGYSGTYLQQYFLFFTKETDLTGYKGGFTPAHLWFLIYLFVISIASLFMIQLQKKYMSKFRIKKFSYIALLILFIPEWLFVYLLNIGGKSIGQFLFLYLIGYYIFSEEYILQTIKKYRFFSLALWILTSIVCTYLYCFLNITTEWGMGLYVLAGWLGILSLLGFGQTLLNFHNPISLYFTKASFPVYIIHQSVLVVVGFFVLKLSVGVALQFLFIIIISFLITILLYEIIKQIPYLRELFGVSKQKNRK